MFSTEGGMDIEDVAADAPDALLRLPVDIRAGFYRRDAEALLEAWGSARPSDQSSTAGERSMRVYRDLDAELIEINPLPSR